MNADQTERPGRHRIDGVQDPSDPKGARRISVWVHVAELKAQLKYVRWKYWNFRTAVEVMRGPKRIFSGIRETETEVRTGWCFTGRPGVLLSAENATYPLPKDRVFVVFLYDNMEVAEWGVEAADPGDPEIPANMNSRFEKQTWPKK